MAELIIVDDSNKPADAGVMWPLAGMTLVALLVRWYGLTTQCFSNDELIDLQIARQSWTAVLQEADGFPPLHHLFLKAVLLVTNSDMAGRWLSVGYGVIAVPIIGLLATRLAGRASGIAAAGLLAIAPMHVFFSQECRAYALFFLVAVLATWLFWRALESDSPRDWATFAVLGSVGGYAHYYYVFVLAALVLIWLIHAAATGRWVGGLLAFVGIGLLSLPVLALVSADIGNQQAMRQGSFSVAAIGFTGWSMLTGFSLGPSLRELHSLSAGQAIQSILVWMIPVGVIVATLLVSLCRRAHPYRVELLALFAIPVVCALLAASALNVSNYNVRYVVPSLMPLIILTAIALTTTRSKPLAVALGLLVVGIDVCSIANRHQVEKYRNVDSASAAQFIAEHSSTSETVYTLAHYMQVAARHYLPEGYEVVPLEDVTTADGNLAETIQLLNEQSGPFWIFYSREFHGDPDGVFKQAMLDDPQVEAMGDWTGVQLYRGVAPITVPTARPTP